MRAGAKSLADEVRSAEVNEQRRSWRKVTTILSTLGVSRLTPAVRGAVARALADVGLACEPSMEWVPRSGTVRLSSVQPPGGANANSSSIATKSPSPIISAQTWTTQTAPRGFNLEAAAPRPDSSVLVVEVNASAEPLDAFASLRRHFGEDLTQEMIIDLLGADDVPKVQLEGSVRNVSTFGVCVRDEQTEADESDIEGSESKAGTVYFETVEFIIGSDWLLTCWHNAAKLLPDGDSTDASPSLRNLVMQRVTKQWPSMSGRSASDLALLISIEMAHTHSLAQQEISQWLESWEATVSSEAGVETATLDSSRRAVREYRKRLQAQDLARRSAPNDRWFADATLAPQEALMKSLIEQAGNRLNTIAQSVRSGAEFVTMTQMRKQLEVTHKAQQDANQAQAAATREQESTRRFQNTLTVLGAILLGPGLVAAIYGANVDLPGKERISGTIILIIGMVVVSVLSYLFMLRMQRRPSRLPDPGSPRAESGRE